MDAAGSGVEEGDYEVCELTAVLATASLAELSGGAAAAELDAAAAAAPFPLFGKFSSHTAEDVRKHWKLGPDHNVSPELLNATRAHLFAKTYPDQQRRQLKDGSMLCVGLDGSVFIQAAFKFPHNYHFICDKPHLLELFMDADATRLYMLQVEYRDKKLANLRPPGATSTFYGFPYNCVINSVAPGLDSFSFSLVRQMIGGVTWWTLPDKDSQESHCFTATELDLMLHDEGLKKRQSRLFDLLASCTAHMALDLLAARDAGLSGVLHRDVVFGAADESFFINPTISKPEDLAIIRAKYGPRGMYGQRVQLEVDVQKHKQHVVRYPTQTVDDYGRHSLELGGPYITIRLVIIFHHLGAGFYLVLFAWWCWDAYHVRIWGVLMLSMKSVQCGLKMTYFGMLLIKLEGIRGGAVEKWQRGLLQAHGIGSLQGLPQAERDRLRELVVASIKPSEQAARVAALAEAQQLSATQAAHAAVGALALEGRPPAMLTAETQSSPDE